MKHLLLIIAVIICATLPSSCTKYDRSAVVIKDCTGVYIEVDKKHHKVCNKEILEHVPHSKEISVSYQFVNSCESHSDDAICLMYHEYDERIHITKVN